MALKLHHCLLLSLFAINLIAAKTYTIQSLVDPNQSGPQFVSPGTSFGLFPINNTQYLGGFAAGNAAIGTLNNSGFSFQPLPPLPGGDSSTILTALKDGSAIGYSVTSFPSPNPNFPPQQQFTLVRWSAGVPSQVVIADPNEPTAFIAPGPFGANSDGDIVGQYSLNGVISAFRYNVLDQSFKVIPVPFDNVFQLVVSSVNEQGKILAFANGPNTRLILYDPAIATWTDIPFPPFTGIGGQALLNSQGQFALSLLDFFSGNSLPFRFDGSQLQPLFTGSLPAPGLNPPSNLQVAGFNRDGTAIGNFNSRLGLFEGGEFIELFPLIENPGDWAPFFLGQTGLSGINDAGQIFGIGSLNGTPTSFVLSPTQSEIPEPSTFLIAATAFAALLAVHKLFSKSNQSLTPSRVRIAPLV